MQYSIPFIPFNPFHLPFAQILTSTREKMVYIDEVVSQRYKVRVDRV